MKRTLFDPFEMLEGWTLRGLESVAPYTPLPPLTLVVLLWRSPMEAIPSNLQYLCCPLPLPINFLLLSPSLHYSIAGGVYNRRKHYWAHKDRRCNLFAEVQTRKVTTRILQSYLWIPLDSWSGRYGIPDTAVWSNMILTPKSPADGLRIGVGS